MDALIERGLLPDWAIRVGIRRLVASRLCDERAEDPVAVRENTRALLAEMRKSPIALSTRDANQQHYEVPPEFFRLVLGKHLKYSSGYWESGAKTLDEAEEAMLRLTCERAEIEDGQEVLELGCGWGSLALFVATNYPKCRVLGASNSATQRAWIDAESARRGLSNLEIVTADMNDFDPKAQFDRIVSVEMFEHMRNWEELFRRVATWLRPNGRFFLHIFSHKDVAYPFESKGESDWMAREFFTGGMMPSDGLPIEVAARTGQFRLVDHWRVNGMNYARTADAWLANMDRQEREIREVFARAYGAERARAKWNAWRVFFMACAELWGYRAGREWLVSQYGFGVLVGSKGK